MSSITNNSPFVNTLMIWKALFLKDALARFFGSRGAWAWLLIEPVAHILGMAFIYALIKKGTMGGVAMQPWIMTGMLVKIGHGQKTETDILQAFENPQPRAAAPTAPAHGLTLVEIRYQ